MNDHFHEEKVSVREQQEGLPYAVLPGSRRWQSQLLQTTQLPHLSTASRTADGQVAHVPSTHLPAGQVERNVR